MSRVLEAEPRLCVRPGCLLGTSEGSPKGYGVGPSFPAAQAGNRRKGRAWHIWRLLECCRGHSAPGNGNLYISLPDPKSSVCKLSPRRHIRASSVSPLTHTNGSRSTQLLWWLPTRASAAPRPHLIYMQWQIMPTTTCSAVRATFITTSLTTPQLRVASS